MVTAVEYARRTPAEQQRITIQHRQWQRANADKVRASHQRYYQKNKEKVADQQRAYHKKHRSRLSRERKAYYRKHRNRELALMKRWDERNPERRREIALRTRLKRYNATMEQYNELLRKQKDVCAICGEKDKRGCRLSLDHDHKHNRLRSLLCGHCNSGLGMFRDRPELCTAAAKYLRRHAS